MDFSFGDIGKSLNPPASNFLFMQQHTFLKGDLKLRLNFQPNFANKVFPTSEQDLIKLFRSCSLGVNPMGERKRSF